MLVPRSSCQTPADRRVYVIAMSAADPSTMAASTTWPAPVVRALRMAASMPKASSMPPPPKSPTRLRGGSGRSPARPMAPSAPDSAM